MCSKSNLIVSLTEKLQLLVLLVHEYAVQVTSLSRTNLNCLVAPAHYLPSADVR